MNRTKQVSKYFCFRFEVFCRSIYLIFRQLSSQHLTLPHSPLVPDGRLATPEKEVVPMLLKSHVVSNCDYVMLLCAQALICALCNGILPSIQSYASLPYGILNLINLFECRCVCLVFNDRQG